MDDTKKEPTDLLDLFAEFLDEVEFKYERDPRGFITTGVTLTNGRWKIVIDADGSGTRALWVLSLAPVHVPSRHIDAATKFVTDLNWRLKVGAFQVDRSDGEVRFRTSLFVGSAEPGAEILQHLFMANLSTMDRCLPGLLRICAGEPPEVALRGGEEDGEIEAPTSLELH